MILNVLSDGDSSATATLRRDHGTAAAADAECPHSAEQLGAT